MKEEEEKVTSKQITKQIGNNTINNGCMNFILFCSPIGLNLIFLR